MIASDTGTCESKHQSLRNSSGSLAILLAIRRASSFVSSLAADRRQGFEIDVGKAAAPLASRAMQHLGVNSAGGGKRRGLDIQFQEPMPAYSTLTQNDKLLLSC